MPLDASGALLSDEVTHFINLFSDVSQIHHDDHLVYRQSQIELRPDLFAGVSKSPEVGMHATAALIRSLDLAVTTPDANTPPTMD